MKVLPSIFISIILISFCNIIICFADSQISQTLIAEKPPISVSLMKKSINSTTYYYANLLAGTPEDTYPVIMSLNSVNTSLFTDICEEAGDPTGKCSTEKKFPVSSTSCHYDTKNGAILNSDRNVTGYVGTEMIGFSEETRFTTDLVFRVNSTMDYNLSGLVSLSPKSLFLELLYNNEKIDEQVFMYKASNKTLKDISELVIGTIPVAPEVENITWIGIISYTKWQLKAFYLAINGVLIQDCQERVRTGFALFHESRYIQLTLDTLSKLTTKMKPFEKMIDNLLFYSCEPADLEKYPVITIYTEEYSINVTADAYLDFQVMRETGDKKQYCRLAIDIADSNSESCITLGYNYFVYNQVLFSKTRNQIGLSGKPNLKSVTMITGDSSRISGLIGLLVLALAFGIAYLGFSHKEDELKKQINTTPDDLNSYSFYEYSDMDT